MSAVKNEHMHRHGQLHSHAALRRSSSSDEEDDSRSSSSNLRFNSKSSIVCPSASSSPISFLDRFVFLFFVIAFDPR